MPDQPNHEREIFEAALELTSAEARSAYLRDQCVDAELRTRVETLLRAFERVGGFLSADDVETQAAASAKTVDMTMGMLEVTEQPGDRIGRYKLREKVGEGGCGVVYVAEQEEPVRRRVALKVIKLGMDTKSVIARFGAERQALAMMDHPNIAKVLDAGATNTGRPYFVMELVRGIKITDYCDQNNLPTRERLDLFIKVCQAIQHAHQKGIIHRDLKPSNILVTLHDGVPVPKIIDFGIAKATEGRLTDLTVYTELHQFLGTPAYMSPEQAEMSGLDIDTRSDIYSLGVLLYELLTGGTPFNTKELIESGLDAMRKTIRETEPLRPSTRLSTMLHADLTAVAKHHRAEPPKFVHLIRGDLDWIVMKSLEKDRARRYDTANGLAMDIQRHLSHEPIVARPPSNLYRFQKLVRRNRLAFAAATAVVVALALGMCLAAWSLVRERAARAHAEASQKAARTEAAKQEAVNNFLNEMFASADPGALSVRDQTKGRTVTVVQVLDVAVKQLEAGTLKDRPEIEAAVRQTLGKTYGSLGQFAAADAQLRRALELNKKGDGPESLITARTLNALSRLLLHQDKLGEAEQLQREELVLQRKLHSDKEHPEVARALYDLAVIRMEEFLGDPRQINQEKAADSETAFREALAMQRRLLPPKHRDLAETLSTLARLLMYRDKLDESQRLFDEALAMQKDLLGPEHPEVASTMQLLSEVIWKQKKAAEAEHLCCQAIAIQRKVLGNDHPALGTSLVTLGEILGEQNKQAESEAAFREALAIRRKALGEDNIHVAWCLKRLAERMVAQEKLTEAEQLCREALSAWLKCRGPGSDGYLETVRSLAGVLKSENKPDEIEALYQEVLVAQSAALGNDGPALRESLLGLADFLNSHNRPKEAAQKYREALNLAPELRAEEIINLSSVVQKLAENLRKQGEPQNAEKLYGEVIAVARQKLSETNALLGQLHRDFGSFLREGGKSDAAIEQYHKSLLIRRPIPNDYLAQTLRDMGFVLLHTGKSKDAEPYLREALVLYRKLHQQEDIWGTAWTSMMLGLALQRQQKLPDAEQAFREAAGAYSNTEGITGPHSGYLYSVFDLSEVLTAEKKWPELVVLLNEVLAQGRQSAADGRCLVVSALIDLALFYQSQNKPDEALSRAREASELLSAWSVKDLTALWRSRLEGMMDLGFQPQVRDLCKRVLASSTTDAWWFCGSSKAFSLVENPANRDPALAVELARRAVESDQKDADSWVALGIAFYRTRDFKQAIAHLEKSAQLTYGGGSQAFFVLAMAHQQLGDTEAARRFYAQAVQWMGEHDSQNHPLFRLLSLRAEAEKLLGLAAKDRIETESPTPSTAK